MKIAQVYSQMDNYQWKNTFDFYVGDSLLEKYEATEFDTLAEKLSNYDLVILGVCANYYGQIDFNKNKIQIDTYLKNGGIIFITDANYGSAENWVNEFYGCEYLAGGPNEGGSSGVVYAQHHPIIEGLKGGDVPPLGWGRLKKANNLKILYTSANNIPHMVYKEVGKGIVVISPSGLGWNMFAFLKNLVAYTRNETRLSYIGKEIKEPTVNLNKSENLPLNLVS
ncbi:MAG: hypothetical protein KBT47_09385, partial [Armatimonadetes bacterium]|nr:hypothetical protein [Candidatus Hippobium faecium]